MLVCLRILTNPATRHSGTRAVVAGLSVPLQALDTIVTNCVPADLCG
jgi:hypothetical protein